jgi:hypothetical protein
VRIGSAVEVARFLSGSMPDDPISLRPLTNPLRFAVSRDVTIIHLSARSEIIHVRETPKSVASLNEVRLVEPSRGSRILDHSGTRETPAVPSETERQLLLFGAQAPTLSIAGSSRMSGDWVPH